MDQYVARVPQTRPCAVCGDDMELTRAGVEAHLGDAHGYSLADYLKDARAGAASEEVEGLEALEWASRCRYECILCDDAPAFRTRSKFRRHLVAAHKETETRYI